jgi:8-oxo-dGTP diphosphatase
MNEHKTNTVVCGLIHRNGKIFVARRAAAKATFPNQFELPGGHVEQGESLRDALERGLNEELQIQVKVGQTVDAFTYISEEKLKCEVVYLCQVIGDSEPTLNPADHSESLWLGEDEIDKFGKNDDEMAILRQGFKLLNKKGVMPSCAKNAEPARKSAITPMEQDLHDIFLGSKYLTIATVCADGSPWATPLGWWAFDGVGCIVFDNRAGTTHADNLARDPRCFITIVNYDQEHSRSAHIKTVARKLSSAEYDDAKKLILDRGLDVSDDIFAAEIGKLDQKMTHGQNYYFINEERAK